MSRVKIKEWFKKPTTIRIILVLVTQTIFALLVDFFGLGAGSIGNFTFIAYADQNVFASSFIILLYAPILASDGGVGVLASKISTSLHLGSIKPRLFKNTKYFYTVMASALTLGLFAAVGIGLITYITNIISAGSARVLNPLPFFIIPILALSVPTVINSQLGSMLAFFIFRRKLDPDVWVYPTVSTLNNITCTVFYALMIIIIQPNEWFNQSTGEYIGISARFYYTFIFAVVYLGFMAYIISKNIKSKDYGKIIKQAIPVQSVILTINSFTGGILSAADKALTNLRGLFAIYPALIDTISDECTIVANTTSTNLALGSIEAKLDAIKDKDLWTNVIGVGIAGLILHIMYGIFGSLIGGDARRMGLVVLIAILINILTYVIVLTIAYFTIIISYRKGLDPEVFAVQLIAALVNLVTSSLILFFTTVVFSALIT